jgi:hypothetical protein
MIPGFEPAKTVHALYRAVTVIDSQNNNTALIVQYKSININDKTGNIQQLLQFGVYRISARELTPSTLKEENNQQCKFCHIIKFENCPILCCI